MITQLTKMWMTNTATLENVSAQTDQTREWNASVKGEVRSYAGGRQRAVGAVGKANTWKFTLVELTQVTCELLETWMNQGVTVFARDHRGQSMYGTFFQVDRTENMAQLYPYATYTATVQLQRVDVVEGV